MTRDLRQYLPQRGGGDYSTGPHLRNVLHAFGVHGGIPNLVGNGGIDAVDCPGKYLLA